MPYPEWAWGFVNCPGDRDLDLPVPRYLPTLNPPGTTGYMRRQSARRSIDQSMSLSRISALRLATGAREMSGVLAVAKDRSPGRIGDKEVPSLTLHYVVVDPAYLLAVVVS